MKDTFICLDVGGTEIKAASMDRQGRLQSEIHYLPARAEEEGEILLEHMAEIIRGCGFSNTDGKEIRMAFPGPFDYDRGICLMQGLGKYDRLYGINLRKELADRLKTAEKRICFLNDASAFALGEMGFGEARGAARALFLCIGTGCGSAFGEKEKLAPHGKEGVPEDGYLYHAPFLDGCIDDYLSRRGLLELTDKRLGTALDGKELAARVRQGDERAAACFLEFGGRIRDALAPFLDAFRPEVLCLGGQISGSGEMFLAPVEESCREKGIRLYVTLDTSLRTLQGLTRIEAAKKETGYGKYDL